RAFSWPWSPCSCWCWWPGSSLADRVRTAPPLGESFAEIGHRAAHLLADGIDRGAHIAPHRAHRADQRILGLVEGVAVAARRLFDLLADLGVLIVRPARVIAAEDAFVVAALDPAPQLGCPQHRERVALQLQIQQ